jgi:hypothetical protein
MDRLSVAAAVTGRQEEIKTIDNRNDSSLFVFIESSPIKKYASFQL